MKHILSDILAMEEVRAVLALSPEGEILFMEPHLDVDGAFPQLMKPLEGIREADILFEKSRLYVRRTDTGYLMVVLSRFGSGAMLRLHVDMALPSLKERGKGKGLRSFFRRGK